MANYQEVRAKTGEDKDGKPIYRQIGRVLSTKNGPMIKIDTLPLQWDGWAYISDPKPKDEQPRTHGDMKRQQIGGYEQASRAYGRDDDDSPPF